FAASSAKRSKNRVSRGISRSFTREGYRRERRGHRGGMAVCDPAAEEGAMTSLIAATLNIRNIADRWPERLPLLLADMAALQPDVIGLQEVVFAAQQDRVLGAAGEGRYETFRAWAGRPEYGNAVLVKGPLRGFEGER